ncbi:MAG: 50S ribosomal protein L30 [Phascolarctobacterium sp.]|nr:50S ribosomal protein L30 [Candidatus Phascolarctobacterium equi]
MAQLKLTLVKSVIGYTKDQQLTVRALGLRKIGTTSVQEDNPVIRGMIHKVEHLVKVEKA